ncbi:GntR family transcriptional regulator [Devosia honganensis]|uniref:GntR family transcriptional regulator n=1 Tax=Devosia honganensis TaxID=1610527 RepID=A0ABV7X5K4_9HYPH
MPLVQPDEMLRQSKSASVLETLKRQIMLGQLLPGEPLIEMEVARNFGCSQGTVREALLKLRDEGLVYRQGHKGTRVSECGHDEAIEMFLVRRGIETRGMMRAVGSGDATLVNDIKDLVRAMEDASRLGDEYRQTQFDRAFHQRLFSAAQLPALEPILDRCLLHNHRYKIVIDTGPRDLKVQASRHWSIVEAIESGDVGRAVAAIGHHIETIIDLGPAIFEVRGASA